ncbi:MAG: phosphotransferase [Clostridia bacterium]|nr:phosphotransferase [Clostridia bacterium]
MNMHGRKSIVPPDDDVLENIAASFFRAKKEINEALTRLADTIAFEQVRKIIEDVYKLGRLEAVSEIEGGYVNKSYQATATANGSTVEYFVRKYRSNVTDEDILFEHSMIEHAVSNGMDGLSRVYRQPDGRSFFRMREITGGKVISRAFAVYQFLDGEDRYAWLDNRMTPGEDRSYGALLAKFHDCMSGFDPGLKAEPSIEEHLPAMRERFAICHEPLSSGDRFRGLWEKSLSSLLAACDEAIARAAGGYWVDLPRCACHCDYHPGNVKWKGEKCASIFDLDWSKMDMRLFDVSCAVIYACASWESADNGEIDFERVEYVLSGYDEYLSEHGSFLRFTREEKDAFPQMMKTGIVYLFDWLLVYCEDAENLNEFEYYYYLCHYVNALDCLNRNQRRLGEIISRI